MKKITCPDCDGEGVISFEYNTFDQDIMCSTCDSTGEVYECPVCEEYEWEESSMSGTNDRGEDFSVVEFRCINCHFSFSDF